MVVKIVVTKHIVEVYEYERLNTRGGGEKIDNGGEFEDENYKQRNKKRRDMVRHLAVNNFDTENSKFITLTYKDQENKDITDPKQCNKDIKIFIRSVRSRYPKFEKYLNVTEFQDKKGRGAVHFHMLIDAPYIPQKEIQELWGHGYVKINRIRHVDNLGAYIVKYMTKETSDNRLKGIKAFEHSRNLIPPEEYKTWSQKDMPKIREILKHLENKTPRYASTYQSEQAGEITFRQYNLIK